MTHPTPTQELLPCPVATDWDHRIIDGTSVALKGEIGMADDVMRLKKLVESGPAKDKLETACEIAVSFIRWAQDLKRQNADDSTRRKLEELLRESIDALREFGHYHSAKSFETEYNSISQPERKENE